ncbi:uncharacterized protein DFL_007833 [Arthrobotrys flagrans]|uniref:Clr5 domain-containing protein n=1 Tax=Arthrobotrys flagrans TaxID=97331 RepID=A0A436ZWU9_ARTFL|nr:hypothetical protein DFL_007833 [Arthrobotrys flagrans]
MRTHKSLIDKWENHRTEIILLYHLGRTQAEIQDILIKEYGFLITVKQLEYRLKQWGARKNLTQREYQIIHKRFSTSPQSTFVCLNDFPIPQEKLQRGLRRYPQQPQYKLILGNMGDLEDNSEGITFVTLPGSPPLTDFGLVVPETGSGDSSVASSGVISNICWPFLPSIAQFLLTVVKNPSFVWARENYVLFFLDFLSVTLPLPRWTYEKVKTRCIEQGTEQDTRNTSIFYAVSKAFRQMNIGEHSYNIYRKFLDSFVVEEFIHTVFSQKGSRGTSKFIALRAILGYETPKSARVLGNTNALHLSSFRFGTSTSESRQPSTSDHMSKKRKRLTDISSSESEDMHGRRNKISRKETADEGLGRRLACPFAKGAPAKYPACLRINRQNLSGVKEHVKRAHYNNALPSDIRATKSWAGIFDFVFPQWGNRPRPGPYANLDNVFEGAHRPQTEPSTVEIFPEDVNPGWSRTQTSQMDEYQDILEDPGSLSIVPSPRMSPNLASTPLSHNFMSSANFTNHERTTSEAPTVSVPREGPSIGKKYTLMIARLPYIPSSMESPGPKRFGFDNFREFGHQFDRWIKSQFIDPLFSWERWELLNQFTNVRLRDTQAVIDDIDFSFLAQNSTRAALYLVAKAEF